MSTKLKVDRPHLRDEPSTPPGVRKTDNDIIYVYTTSPIKFMLSVMVQVWERWRTDGQTLPSALSVCFAKLPGR